MTSLFLSLSLVTSCIFFLRRIKSLRHGVFCGIFFFHCVCLVMLLLLTGYLPGWLHWPITTLRHIDLTEQWISNQEWSFGMGFRESWTSGYILGGDQRTFVQRIAGKAKENQGRGWGHEAGAKECKQSFSKQSFSIACKSQNYDHDYDYDHGLRDDISHNPSGVHVTYHMQMTPMHHDPCALQCTPPDV